MPGKYYTQTRRDDYLYGEKTSRFTMFFDKFNGSIGIAGGLFCYVVILIILIYNCVLLATFDYNTLSSGTDKNYDSVILYACYGTKVLFFVIVLIMLLLKYRKKKEFYSKHMLIMTFFYFAYCLISCLVCSKVFKYYSDIILIANKKIDEIKKDVVNINSIENKKTLKENEDINATAIQNQRFAISGISLSVVSFIMLFLISIRAG